MYILVIVLFLSHNTTLFISVQSYGPLKQSAKCHGGRVSCGMYVFQTGTSRHLTDFRKLTDLNRRLEILEKKDADDCKGTDLKGYLRIP